MKKLKLILFILAMSFAALSAQGVIGGRGGGGVPDDNSVDAGKIKDTNSPVDNYVLSYDAATGNFTWVLNSGGGTGDLLSDGSIALTANWDVGAYTIRGLTFTSDVATGTAPFNVASTTVVTSLNADYLDGNSGDYYLDNTDAQTLGISGNNVTLTNGGTADISSTTAVGLNTAKVTNQNHTGDVTGSTALTIAADAVDISMLSASGTPSATTYLRGDNTWSTVPGGGVTDHTLLTNIGNDTHLELEADIDALEVAVNTIMTDTVSTTEDLHSFPFGLGAGVTGNDAGMVVGAYMGGWKVKDNFVRMAELALFCLGSGGDINIQMFHGANPGVAGTAVIASTQVTTAGGEVILTTFSVSDIPEDDWLWCEVTAVGTAPLLVTASLAFHKF